MNERKRRTVFLDRLKIYKQRLTTYFAEIEKLKREYPGSYERFKMVKYFFPWFLSLRQSANPLADERPWIIFEAQEFFDGILNKNMHVFEYGSGGSTIFFAKRVGAVVSIEHHREWYNRVTQELHRKKIYNGMVRLAEPENHENFNADFMDPAGYASDGSEYKGKTFKKYASSIDGYPDGNFDVIVIDGRARISCFKHTLKKLKVNGYLMLDNAECANYAHIHESLSGEDWQKYSFYGPGPYNMYFWRTCFWKKLR